MRLKTSTQSLSFIYILCTLATLGQGCAGAVHFISGEPLAKIQKIDAQNKAVYEQFTLGVPTGRSEIFFVLDPLYTMKDVNLRLYQSYSLFLESFVPRAKTLHDLVFSVERDVDLGVVTNHSSQSPLVLDQTQDRRYLADEYLRKNLRETDGSFYDSDSSPFSPFTTFNRILSLITSQSPRIQDLVWVDFIYFMDRDIQLNEDAIKQVQGQILNTRTQLGLQPLSKFRTRFHVLTFHEDSCLDFKTTQSLKLRALFNGFSYESKDLCDLFARPQVLFEEIADDILNRTQRIILGKSPIRSTLKVMVNGKELLRQDVDLNVGSNEIFFRQNIASKGDLIEVSYEPMP